MTDPYARTPEGLFDRLQQRITSLETRLGRGLAGRVAPAGQQVTLDWNDATEAGFYWSTGSTPQHQPYSSTWQGDVAPGYDGRIIQTLTNRLTPGLSWKRSRNAPDVATSFNGHANVMSPYDPRMYIEYEARWSWARAQVASGSPDGGAYMRFTAPSSQDSNGRGWDAYANADLANQTYAQALRMRPVWVGEKITVEAWVRSSKATRFRINSRIHDGVNQGGWLQVFQVGANDVAVPANTWTKVTQEITPAATGFIALQVAALPGTAYVSGDTIDGSQFSVRYSRGEWTPWRRSDNILIPARCVGGSASAGVLRPFDMQTGRYNLAAGDRYFAMDGIFTDEFREYEMYIEWATNQTNGGGVRFRQNTLEVAPGTGYEFQALWGSGTSAASLRGFTNQGTFPPEGALGHQARIRFVNPAYPHGSYTQKRMHGKWMTYNPSVSAMVDSNLIGYDQQILDGFSIYTSDQAMAGIIVGADSFMYVRGIA